MGLLVLLKEPSPGPAQGVVSIQGAVVMEKVQGGKALLREEVLHFGHRGPPVVVVPLHQILFAGELVQKAEVRLRLIQVDAPGGVPRQDQHIAGGQPAQSIADALHVILPGGAEHLHRLVRCQGEVQVPDGVEGHAAPLLSLCPVRRSQPSSSAAPTPRNSVDLS
ncbi:Uncharacterised protein [uncultured Blautia sp.]|nr:Uncharacterised protein [uncultured Blautia sp.]